MNPIYYKPPFVFGIILCSISMFLPHIILFSEQVNGWRFLYLEFFSGMFRLDFFIVIPSFFVVIAIFMNFRYHVINLLTFVSMFISICNYCFQVK